MPFAEQGIVEQLQRISELTWDMVVYAPRTAVNSKAGQFVHVRINSTFNPFLRRPLSIGPSDGDYLRLIFNVVGSGTTLLAQRSPGDPVDLIGPLGASFISPEEKSRPILVGGGIGVVPLLRFSAQLNERFDPLFLLGVRSASFLTVTSEEMKRRNIKLASDDGSQGFRGNVIELLEQELKRLPHRNVTVYGCGPGPMLTSLKKVCERRSIQLYVSLEVPMGCGVGACQSCAVPRADGNGYLLVCKDGPVFNANDVIITPEALP